MKRSNSRPIFKDRHEPFVGTAAAVDEDPCLSTIRNRRVMAVQAIAALVECLHRGVCRAIRSLRIGNALVASGAVDTIRKPGRAYHEIIFTNIAVLELIL